MKSDANTPAIVAALRDAGCSVAYILSRPGSGQGGLPDLLVGRGGVTYLLEVKAPKVGKLSDDQRRWHREWRGRFVDVVTTIEEALIAVEAN